MITGKCLCGAITYTLGSELLYMYNCHCVQCRAFSGASFATNAFAPAADLVLEDPGKLLREYSRESGSRYFCGTCGSPLYSAAQGQDFLSLHCGSITGYPDKALDANIWVSEKCPWVAIDPELQNFDKAFT